MTPPDGPERHEPFTVGAAAKTRPAAHPAEESERLIETFLAAAREYAETDRARRDPRHLLDAVRLLVDRLRQRENEIEELSRIAERVSWGVSLDETLEFVYTELRDVIPYNRIGFSLIDETRGTVYARWARSDRPMLLTLGYEAPLENSTLRTILETGRPRVINDLEDYLARKPSSDSTRLVVEEGMRSSLTCPLIVQGRPVGFMFFSSVAKDVYSDVHVSFFRQIAGQLSAIVEKSRLYSELAAKSALIEQHNEEMTRDMEMARQVQRALIPQEPPDVPGLEIAFEYEPAIQVGGDLLDVVSAGEDAVLFLVADVMGHGAQAALVVSLIKAALQPAVEADPQPEHVLDRLNRTLTDLLGFSFVTAACCLIDRGTHVARIALAGHQPPLRVGARSGEVTRPGTGDLPLGVDRGARYASSELTLEPGDTLLFFTDGIVEAMDGASQQYGTARLETQFRTHAPKHVRELLREIRADLDRHCAGRQLADDLTLLAVRTAM